MHVEEPEYTPVMYAADLVFVDSRGVLAALHESEWLGAVLLAAPSLAQDLERVRQAASVFADVRGPSVSLQTDDAAGPAGYVVRLRLGWRTSALEHVLQRAKDLELGKTEVRWQFAWLSPQGEQFDEPVPRD